MTIKEFNKQAGIESDNARYLVVDDFNNSLTNPSGWDETFRAYLEMKNEYSSPIYIVKKEKGKPWVVVPEMPSWFK